MIGATTVDVFRVVGNLATLSSCDRALLLDRSSSPNDAAIREGTRRIIDRVRGGGDAALIALAAELDGVKLTALEVAREQCEAALAGLPAALRRVMTRAAGNIESVHRSGRPVEIEAVPEAGIRVLRRPDPLRRVGIYAPGGRAAYPSSVLMGAIPARVAGVGEVILCSPPDPTGLPPQSVLAAAALSGVDRVFAIGGAGAIAAMAYGTASIPRVDRIVGPGNAYVAEAKLQVAAVTGIDSPAGPSELLVIADNTASPQKIALEVLAQAEHDPMAVVVVIAVGEELATTIADEIAKLIPSAPREAIVTTALRDRGALLTVDSLEQAIAFANDFAPEHLLLACGDPAAICKLSRNAGAVFLGETSSVTYGDYLTGANHVLPTGGLARSYSGLSVLDFMRWTTVQSVDRAAAARLADDVAIFARAEGLPGHAAAAQAGGRQ
jgi:histidinol dehydrogenase